MKRHLFILCSGLSFLLCVSVVTISVVGEGPSWRFIVAKRDTLCVSIRASGTFALVSDGKTYMAGADQPLEIKWSALGFRFWKSTYRGKPVWNLWVPYWFPIAGTAILPLVWLGSRLRHWRRRERRSELRCANCGYDLRGTPERCPECGRAADFVRVSRAGRESTKGC